VPAEVREEVVDVALAEILEDYGLEAVSLERFNEVPDVYLIYRGARLILEAKRDDLRGALESQLRERLEKNLCDVAVGVLFPRELLGTEPGRLGQPTPGRVRERLRVSRLVFLEISGSGRDFAEIDGRIADLPELLDRFVDELVARNELDEVVRYATARVETFVRNVSRLGSAKNIARSVEEVLSGLEE